MDVISVENFMDCEEKEGLYLELFSALNIVIENEARQG